MPRPTGGGAYRAVLQLPHARALFGAAMLARLSYGLLSLPLLLSLRAGTGSYALAGTATGLFGLLTAVLGPFRARLVARRPGTLAPMSLLYGALLAAIAGCCAYGLPDWTALALTVLAGACPPPVGPLTRATWSALAADEALRQTALSLDTVSELGGLRARAAARRPPDHRLLGTGRARGERGRGVHRLPRPGGGAPADGRRVPAGPVRRSRRDRRRTAPTRASGARPAADSGLRRDAAGAAGRRRRADA